MSNDGAPQQKARRPGNRNRKPSAWQRSATFAAIGVQTLDWFRAHRHEYAKCGARAKSTGKPCRQLALANGKCRWHGGLTPTSDQWGKRQIRPKPPRKQRMTDWHKTEAKLIEWRRQDEDRVRRLRAMTDRQFFAYLRRMSRRLNDPYSPTFNKAVRDELVRRGPDPRTNVALVLKRRGKEDRNDMRDESPEVVAIEGRLNDLREEMARAQQSDQSNGGVFD